MAHGTDSFRQSAQQLVPHSRAAGAAAAEHSTFARDELVFGVVVMLALLSLRRVGNTLGSERQQNNDSRGTERSMKRSNVVPLSVGGGQSLLLRHRPARQGSTGVSGLPLDDGRAATATPVRMQAKPPTETAEIRSPRNSHP